MRKIPKKLLNDILSDEFYKKCIRHEEKTCQGRVTLEHAFIYAGRQINEKWAIVPVCEYHHGVGPFQDGGDLDKELNQFIAVMRASDDDLRMYPKKDWRQIKSYLMSKYGTKRK